MADTPANRKLIEEVSNGKALCVDSHGKTWYTGVDSAGKPIYTYTQGGVVKGAGYMDRTPEQLVIDLNKTK
jgi:hypothetical protein